MRRHWLIDAHNLMHKLPHAGEAYSRNRLEGITVVLQYVDQFCRKHNRHAYLVFDGHPIHLPDKPETCQFKFSGNKPADLVIRNILRKKASHNRWTVVSDDREVQRYARQAGCEVTTATQITEDRSSKFDHYSENKPVPGEDPGVQLSDEEVEEWKDIFGID